MSRPTVVRTERSPVIDSLIDSAFALLLLVGLPALFVFFFLKGALIGKPLPTSVFLPGYVLAVSASGVDLLVIVLVSSTGYVTGQLAVYYSARRKGIEYLTSAPRIRISEAKLKRSEELFEHYGGPAIFLTNFVPYVRGLILIPAGIASYSVVRVIVYALSSTLIYHAAIVAVALGIVSALL
jgi:membrane protein DedA with SNARE-associated domain